MDFYEQLDTFKKLKGLGYIEMGAAIGKKSDAFRKAAIANHLVHVSIH